MEKLSTLYINEIIEHHGTPTSIISDHDSRFTSLHTELRTMWGSRGRATLRGPRGRAPGGCPADHSAGRGQLGSAPYECRGCDAAWRCETMAGKTRSKEGYRRRVVVVLLLDGRSIVQPLNFIVLSFPFLDRDGKDDNALTCQARGAKTVNFKWACPVMTWLTLAGIQPDKRITDMSSWLCKDNTFHDLYHDLTYVMSFLSSGIPLGRAFTHQVPG
ncbi:hypothetical protein E3N88_38583 [Mikania micrantha]|uniref:Integrase catalytic domain-containing protein n=1 Tax=Mikania micrantha TaxID=192012 RepID=A0A5N6LUD9_9ASTR|nr:hypothetical protein E3N88_38583 [Mikania micrantha]